MDYGILYLAKIISIPSDGDRPRRKKVNLCNFYCTKDEVPAKLVEFNFLNPDLEDVGAEWVYREFFDNDFS
jgi:hypothetical protein